jgi:sugar lactone lactonase YvrE
MMYFSPEELEQDEKKWKTILNDVDFTHDGYIYFNEFENAIQKFIKESELLMVKKESENQ